jgi:hypothetical protein
LKQNFQILNIYGAALVIALLGVFIDGFMQILEKRFRPGRNKGRLLKTAKFEVENMFFYNKFFYKKKLTSLILTALTMILLWGCSREQSNIVVRMAYQGEVEEAPVIIAYEKGFFKKEGVDVELVRQDFEGIKAAIENGGIHGATFDYRAFEAVDSGSNIKLVAGLHSGCTQIIVKRIQV